MTVYRFFNHLIFGLFLFGPIGFGILRGQVDPAMMAKISQLTPKQKAELLKRLSDSGNTPFTKTQPNPSPSVQALEGKDDPVGIALQDRRDLLSRLKSMEAMVRADLSRLEAELVEAVDIRDRELSEALEETRSLLDKIKDLQRREIEKQTKKFAEDDLAALKPYGYDLFAGAPSTFAPGNEVPVPPDYAIGPGDLLEVQLFGQENASYSLIITREGLIQFPGIGPINVFEKGTDFLSLKNLLKEKIRERLGAGVQSSISMGALRSIRIFLLGDVHRPGAYVVSSLSTMTNALLVGGGIKEIGSLRQVQLKRRGEVVARLDLYDLLLKGDTSGDARIRPGDVIFVPPVGVRATVGGAVLRPAKYELLGGETLAEALDLAGGLEAMGYGRWIRMQRFGLKGRLVVRTLDFETDKDFALVDGDSVTVSKASRRLEEFVTLEGEVERPGDYEFKDGMRVGDLLPDFDTFLPEADRRYGLVRRIDKLGVLEVLTFRPGVVVADPNSSFNLTLNRRDTILVLNRDSSEKRSLGIEPLLAELRAQGTPASSTKIVSVSGLVNFPGEYPLTNGMRISDLLVAGGGLRDSAFVLAAELTRMRVLEGKLAEIEHVLAETLGGLEDNGSQDLLVQPYDTLSVKSVPSWREREVIEISGEVKFPGAYPVKQGETLSDVLSRAGGLTDQAYPEGAVFTRLSLQVKEERQRQRLIAQLETDVANLTIRAQSQEEVGQAQSAASGLLARLKATESAGRLVIELSEILSGKGEYLIEARGGDRLSIPRIPYEVSVVGEVQFPTSHLHAKKLDVEDYVKRSGGYTANADKDRTFTVRANGAVLTKGGSGWFSASGSGTMRPGDVVVVPIDVKQGRLMENIANATQIVYQLAVTAAAVNSF